MQTTSQADLNVLLDGDPEVIQQMLTKLRSDVLAPATRKTYAEQWRLFLRWCVNEQEVPLPANPLTVARYLRDSALLKRPDGQDLYRFTTIQNWSISIDHYHAVQGLTKPSANDLVSLTLDVLRHTMDRPARKWRALSSRELFQLVRSIRVEETRSTVKAYRDRAILMLGYTGAFRRSELAALKIEDIRFADESMIVSVPKSKTDQNRDGQIKGFPYHENPQLCVPCYVLAYLAALTAQAAGVDELTKFTTDSLALNPNYHRCRGVKGFSQGKGEPLFRPLKSWKLCVVKSMVGRDIHTMLRDRLRPLGYDVSLYGSHTLRISFVTEALLLRSTDSEVMNQTGHKSAATLRIYTRHSDPLASNAVNNIWERVDDHFLELIA
jgi:integrase